jgi:hypothetical protein
MRLWQFFPNDMWEAPTTLSVWVSAYQMLLATPLQEKRLLVIDGLDEVKACKLRPYLTVEPSANLKIIVTLRDVGQPWADEYGFPKAKTQHLSLAGFTREDVREVLQMAGLVAGAFADNPALLDKVVHVTSPEETVAGADPLYVTSLAADIESRRITAANIAQQPRRLEDYLQRWWQEIVAVSGQDSSVLDLLGTLAAALGPIRRDDLVAINPSLKPSWTFDPIQKALANIRRTVAGNDTTGYSFAHPRFRDYLHRYPEVATYETKLVAYCERWREHKGRYALRYGVQH